MWQACKIYSDILISTWENIGTDENATSYYYTYAGLLIGSSVFVLIRLFVYSKSMRNVHIGLHKDMVTSMIRAPLSLFHDITPKGRLLNRLTKELFDVDINSLFVIFLGLTFLFNFIGSIISCAIFEPLSLVFLPLISLICYKLIKIYTPSNRELFRIEGASRSPMVSMISETIPGMITVRAFDKENELRKEYSDRINDNFLPFIYVHGVKAWLGLTLDLVSWAFMAFLITYTFYNKEFFTPGFVGVLITNSITIQSSLFSFLDFYTQFENIMISLERCIEYTQIESEVARHTGLDDELDWPSRGKIEFADYSVKYRPNTSLVLKDLNFTIQPGEKIGIVGRTGSGKSTMCLCLFRILEATSGLIKIDGVDISKLGLQKLRNSLTIIPQDPVLTKNTLRYNIDPLDKHTNDEIRAVFKMIKFEEFLRKNNGLTMLIEEGGNNLSVGERQMICVVRAILRVNI